MSLTHKDAREIADYARLALTDEERAQMAVYLNDAVEHVLNPMRALDLEGVEPLFHPIGGLVNAMREDVPFDGLTLESALQNAPLTEGRYIRVPSILNNGGAA